MRQVDEQTRSLQENEAYNQLNKFMRMCKRIKEYQSHSSHAEYDAAKKALEATYQKLSNSTLKQQIRTELDRKLDFVWSDVK